MKKPIVLDVWNFPDTHMEPDGYDMKSVTEFTARNFDLLIEEHNNLVEVVTTLLSTLDPTGIVFDD